MKGDGTLRYGGDGVGCVGIDMRGFNECNELTGLCWYNVLRLDVT